MKRFAYTFSAIGLVVLFAGIYVGWQEAQVAGFSMTVVAFGILLITWTDWGNSD